MKDSEHPSVAPSLPHPALALGYRPSKQFKSIEDRINNAMKIMARIIAEEGEEYLPIFLRLEEELEKHQRKNNALQRAESLLHSGEKFIGVEPSK